MSEINLEEHALDINEKPYIKERFINILPIASSIKSSSSGPVTLY